MRRFTAIFALLLFACDDGAIGRVDPEIEISPSPIVFDTVPWHTAARQVIGVHNNGAAPLFVSSLELRDSSPFTLLDLPSGGFAIAAGQSRAFVIRFDSGETGLGETSLIARSDDPASPRLEVPVIARRRSGPVLAVCIESAELGLSRSCAEPSQLDFGAIRRVETRDARVILRSEGTAPLSIAGLRLSGSDRFLIDDFSPITLEPGAEHAIQVRFAPGGSGDHRAHLEIAADDPRLVELSGRGADLGLCLSEEQINFGLVPIGDTAKRALFVRNCGAAAVEIFSAALLENQGEIALTTTISAPVSLPARNLRFELGLSYRPRDWGLDRDRLRISTSVGDAIVPLRGASDRCVIRAPDRVEITAQLGNNTRRAIAVENVGPEPCDLLALSLPSPELQLEPFSSPQTMAPGERINLQLTYAPIDLHADTATLSITTSGSIAVDVAIDAHPTRSTEPCFAIPAPNVIDFGTIPSGETRTEGLFLSLGPGPCAIEEVSFAAGSDPVLTLAALRRPLPRLARDEAMTIGVTASPLASGAFRGTLRIRVNDDVRPVLQIPIIGRAAKRTLCLEPEQIHLDGDARSIELHACGDEAVTIEVITATTSDFELSPTPALPLQLAAGERRTFLVHDRREIDGDTRASIVIRSSDAFRPVRRLVVTAGSGILPEQAGRWIQFTRARSSTEADLVRVPLQGRASHEIRGGSSARCSGCHNVSPDGRYLVVRSEISSGLSFLDLETGHEQEAPFDVDPLVELAWRPDVEADPPYQLVYSLEGDLHLASLHHGYLGVLAGANDPDFFEQMPHWGSTGQIVFVKRGELLIVPENGGAASAVRGASANGRLSYQPAFSPDGDWIAFTDSPIPTSTTTTLPARARVTRLRDGLVLALAEADGRSMLPRWTLDGTGLVLSSDRFGGAGGFDLWLVPFDLASGVEGAPINLRALNTSADEYDARFSR